MTVLYADDATPPLTLNAASVAELMETGPLSIRDDAAVADALRLLAGRRCSAAPVVDAAGRAVGVVHQAGLLAPAGRPRPAAERLPEYYTRSELATRPGVPWPESAGPDPAGALTVGDVMAPLVFSVGPYAGAREVVEELAAWHLHRILVVDRDGRLIGVVSADDLWNRLLA